MYDLANGRTKKRLSAVLFALLALVVLWWGIRDSSPQTARDFEECAERADAGSSAIDGRGVSRADCNARFAGRRKAGGGYTYYDFMQNRHFDIAGPNPTAAEHRQIDAAYMGFLDAQRRDDAQGREAVELARKQNEQLRADLESARQPAGPPMILTPANSPSKRPVDRSKSSRCEDGSLSCSWARFSSVVKNAFASSGKRPNPPVISD